MGTETMAAECTFLLHHLFQSIDHQRYDEAVSLFSAECVYKTPRGELTGPDAIRAALESRPQSHTTRHLISSFAAIMDGEGRSKGLAYLLMYRATDPAPQGVPSLPPPEAIADINCSFRDTPAGWRISRIVIEPALAA